VTIKACFSKTVGSATGATGATAASAATSAAAAIAVSASVCVGACGFVSISTSARASTSVGTRSFVSVGASVSASVSGVGCTSSFARISAGATTGICIFARRGTDNVPVIVTFIRAGALAHISCEGTNEDKSKNKKSFSHF